MAPMHGPFLRTGKHSTRFGKKRRASVRISQSRTMDEGDFGRMKRLMRLRASRHLRYLCAETEFNRAQLIQPLFVVEGLESEEPIPGLGSNVRHSASSLLGQIERDLAAGVSQFLLFPVPGQKKEKGF